MISYGRDLRNVQFSELLRACQIKKREEYSSSRNIENLSWFVHFGCWAIFFYNIYLFIYLFFGNIYHDILWLWFKKCFLNYWELVKSRGKVFLEIVETLRICRGSFNSFWLLDNFFLQYLFIYFFFSRYLSKVENISHEMDILYR